MGKLRSSFILLMTVVVLVGCTFETQNENRTSNNGEQTERITIGYFPNIDHVTAMIAREQQYFEEELGDNVQIDYITFPDGGTFMTALNSGEIVAGLVGPGPVMNHYANGADVTIVSGASSGGTVVVASENSGITSLEQLSGKTFVTPGIGCTHNVQFEEFLRLQNRPQLSSTRIGGTLQHVTGNPAQYGGMLSTNKVDLAVVPEPWASILISEGAQVVVNSDEIAYGQTLPNTVLVVNGKLVNEKDSLVSGLVKAQQRAIDFIETDFEEAVNIGIKGIKDITNQQLDFEIVKEAMSRINYTSEVDEEIIREFAQSSTELQFLTEKPNLDGLVDLSFQ